MYLETPAFCSILLPTVQLNVKNVSLVNSSLFIQSWLNEYMDVILQA